MMMFQLERNRPSGWRTGRQAHMRENVASSLAVTSSPVWLFAGTMRMDARDGDGAQVTEPSGPSWKGATLHEALSALAGAPAEGGAALARRAWDEVRRPLAGLNDGEDALVRTSGRSPSKIDFIPGSLFIADAQGSSRVARAITSTYSSSSSRNWKRFWSTRLRRNGLNSSGSSTPFPSVSNERMMSAASVSHTSRPPGMLPSKLRTALSCSGLRVSVPSSALDAASSYERMMSPSRLLIASSDCCFSSRVALGALAVSSPALLI